MVTRYDVISSRWSSNFWVEMHVFSTFFNNKSFVQFYFGDPPGQSETDSLFTGHHFTQLYNYILAIHRGDPKHTPCSLVTFSRRFTNIYPPRKNACKLNEWQAARLTSSFDFNFFRRWAFPPQNIYRRKDLSSLQFIHKSCWKIIQLFVEILTVNRS